MGKKFQWFFGFVSEHYCFTGPFPKEQRHLPILAHHKKSNPKPQFLSSAFRFGAWDCWIFQYFFVHKVSSSQSVKQTIRPKHSISLRSCGANNLDYERKVRKRRSPKMLEDEVKEGERVGKPRKNRIQMNNQRIQRRMKGRSRNRMRMREKERAIRRQRLDRPMTPTRQETV